MTNIINAELKKIFKKPGLIIFWAFSLLLGYACVRNFSVADSYADLFSKFYGLAPLMGILMFSMFSGSFVLEYSSNMDSIIKSTKNGKNKLVLAKGIAYGIASSIINLSILLIMSFKVISGNDFKGLDMAIKNIWYFGNSGSNITVLQMLLITCLTIILGSFLFAQLGLWLSSVSKKAIMPFFLGGILMGLPYFSNLFGISQFIPKNLVGFTPLWGMYSFQLMRYKVGIAGFVVFIILSTVGSFILYKLGNKGFLQER